MPTNEERREVAAKLRNYENLRESFKESPICAFINALGFGGYLDWKGVCSRLADLIEPEPERTCKIKHWNNASGVAFTRGECSECGGYLMENAVTCEPRPYCPHCGAKVVQDAD